MDTCMDEDPPEDSNAYPLFHKGMFDEVLGAEIVQNQPDCMHFITGVAFFDVNPSNPRNLVADNMQFRQIINSYFQARLQDQSYVDTLTDASGKPVLKVTGEIDGVLAKAKSVPIARLQGTESIPERLCLPERICIWKKVRPHDQKSLKESTWRYCHFRDVSNDPKEIKKVLSQPLRTELSKLYRKQRSPSPDRPTSHRSSPDEVRERELHESEELLVGDIRARINHPGSYIAALFTLRDDQDNATPANHYAAELIADSWCHTKDKKRRFVYRFDASTPGALSESYLSQAQLLKTQHGGMAADAVPSNVVGGLPQAAAAHDFMTIFRSHFPPDCECILIYTNVPHPDAFEQGFLPQMWLQDVHCRDTIRGVLLCTQHPEYMRKSGPPFGQDMAFRPIEWKPRDTETGQACWWDRLPSSNLPYVSHDVQEPAGIEPKLRIDGRAFSIVGGSPAVTNHIASQAIRKWESEAIGRFAIWIDATDEEQLREGYQAAIRQVTFSSSEQPLGDPATLSTRSMADSLMALLALKRTLSKRDHRWALIFANDTSGELFHQKFFSADSNWWNSRGRFIVTTSQPCVKVEIDINGAPFQTQLQSIVCPNDLEPVVNEEPKAAKLPGSVAAATVAAAPAGYEDVEMGDRHYYSGPNESNGVRHNVDRAVCAPGLKKRKAQPLRCFINSSMGCLPNTTRPSPPHKVAMTGEDKYR